MSLQDQRRSDRRRRRRRRRAVDVLQLVPGSDGATHPLACSCS